MNRRLVQKNESHPAELVSLQNEVIPDNNIKNEHKIVQILLKKHGAYDNETLAQFIERLCSNLAQLELENQNLVSQRDKALALIPPGDPASCTECHKVLGQDHISPGARREWWESGHHVCNTRILSVKYHHNVVDSQRGMLTSIKNTLDRARVPDVEVEQPGSLEHRCLSLCERVNILAKCTMVKEVDANYKNNLDIKNLAQEIEKNIELKNLSQIPNDMIKLRGKYDIQNNETVDGWVKRLVLEIEEANNLAQIEALRANSISEIEKRLNIYLLESHKILTEANIQTVGTNGILSIVERINILVQRVQDLTINIKKLEIDNNNLVQEISATTELNDPEIKNLVSEFSGIEALNDCLQEIDELLQNKGFWTGGRIDSIIILIEKTEEMRSLLRTAMKMIF